MDAPNPTPAAPHDGRVRGELQAWTFMGMPVAISPDVERVFGCKWMILPREVVQLQDDMNRHLSNLLEIDAFTPMPDPRVCPACGHKLAPGEWPWCDSKHGHERVEQGVGHPVVVRWD
jgi:hypothetical protein